MFWTGRNINGNKDVKFLIGIIGHCTDERKLLYQRMNFTEVNERHFLPVRILVTLESHTLQPKYFSNLCIVVCERKGFI